MRLASIALAIGAPSARAALWPDAPEHVRSELESPDVMRRRAAAADASHVLRAEALPLLNRALIDPDIEVRLAAAEGAGRAAIREVSERILPWLTDPDARLREAAGEYFVRVPESRAVKVLARALGDVEPRVRLAAVRALGISGSLDAVAPLLARLDDSSSKVRLGVARALARLADPRAVTPLVSKIQDEASEVRHAVVRAIGELGDARAAPALVVALNDQTPDVRIEALSSLGRLRAADAVASIAPLTVENPKRPGSAAVRRAALAALGRIATAPAIDAIIQSFGLFEDIAGVTDSPARDAIISAGPTAIPPLLALLQEGMVAGDGGDGGDRGDGGDGGGGEGRRGREAGRRVTGPPGQASDAAVASAVYALGALRGGGVGGAGAARGAGDVIVRTLRRGRVAPAVALHALASVGDPTYLPICLEYVASSDRAARREALLAAARLLDPERPDGRAVEPLLASLDIARTPEDRAEIATLLGRTGAQRVVPVLVGLTAAKDERLRTEAVDALGTVGAAAAGPTLLALLDDPSGVVRMHAGVALGRSGGADTVAPVLARMTSAAEADRLASVIALVGLFERHGEASAVDAARRAVSSELGADRDILIGAIARAKVPEATAALLDIERHSQTDRETRRAVAVALGARVDDAVAASAVRTLARDPDATVRAQGAWSLGAIGVESDLLFLAPLTRDTTLAVATNAIGAMGRILARRAPAAAPAPAWSALCDALVDERSYVRANALAALAHAATGSHAPPAPSADAHGASGATSCDVGAIARRVLAEDPDETARAAAARFLQARAGGVAGERGDERAAARDPLERCAVGDPSGAVARLCGEALRAKSTNEPHGPPPHSQGAPTLVVFVAPDDGGPPIPGSAYAIERPDGLLHLGTADRRGAVLEIDLPKGTLHLRVPAPRSAPVSPAAP